MCVYDFDYYVESIGLTPWVNGRCDCGYQPAPGELVHAWQQSEGGDDYDMVNCPICDGEGGLRVVDDYGNETDVERKCWRCDDEGSVMPDGWEPETGFFCARCDAARLLLDKWCDGSYSWSTIPEQVAEHWDEDELYRSYPLAKLVALAGRNWSTHGHGLIEVSTIERLVEQAIERVAVPA